MKTIGFSLVLVALGLGSAAQGCAKAADTGGSSDGVGGFDGSGGSVAEGVGGSTSGAGGASTSSAGGSSSTTTAGSTTTGSTTATTTSSSSTSSSATSSASSSASTGSGMGCPMGQHQCGGVCTGNTPQTGCFGSSDCLACPPAPVNGTSSCAADGTCDFTCGASYTKQGGSCVCSFACCTDADCGGGSACVGGSCSVAPPTCDGSACTASCVFSCVSQGKFGAGTCINNACVCVCL